MIISYNWLNDYLPVKTDPEKLGKILTSIGLEVESLEKYESLKGGLAGLVTGEVLTCEKHPDADKLKVTTVNTGAAEALQIVCGAANVAAGQKVIVAPVNTRIYPVSGDPVLIKKAKIRGIESQGMICAEDEIGLGTSHEGIMILPGDTEPGKAVAALFVPYEDFIYEIGLTPNRMDAMSHLGVARDVCAYLSHHDKKETLVKSPFRNNIKADNQQLSIEVIVKNQMACQRYSGISISNITVAESPEWMKQKLKAIGVKPISNIVDITNFILHESGQPLHAFDADKIKGRKIIVGNVAADTLLKTLDSKEHKLSADDLVISNAEEPMCIAGVYGGLESGVTAQTRNIFLESAWFAQQPVRKTSLRHGLRTDAATRFEKGVDISNTVNVLKRAALLIKELCGGEFSSNITDVYPVPAEPKSVGLKYHYLKKLSGKNYHGDTVKNILTALGFVIAKDNIDELWVNVPLSKPDIELPADIVEEIMRIDGLDNIDIPGAISISPSSNQHVGNMAIKEKVAGYLTGLGFYEIFTNSITNSKYYGDAMLANTARMINSLSADLDVMRPSLLETGLEVIAHNINRKNHHLRLFEMGKTYSTSGIGQYSETKHLAIYVTGNTAEATWQQKAVKADFYYLKAVCERIFAAMGLPKVMFELIEDGPFETGTVIRLDQKIIGKAGVIDAKTLNRFSIKEQVLYADLHWDNLLDIVKNNKIQYKQVGKYPSVERDLAIIVDKGTEYAAIEKVVADAWLSTLQSVKLFDIFESAKLGEGKKSMAMKVVFGDETKTLTDQEIDGFMNKLIRSLEQSLQAEIRK